MTLVTHCIWKPLFNFGRDTGRGEARFDVSADGERFLFLTGDPEIEPREAEKNPEVQWLPRKP